MMLQSLDIVLIQSNVHMNGKNVRRTRQIVEIIDIDSISKEILTNEVFHWDPVTDKHIYLGKSYILERIRSQCDMSIEGLSEEFRRRVHILDWMRQKNIRVFNDVATIISSYKENPTELMKQMEAEENQSSTVTTPHSRENKNNNIDKNKQKIVDKRKSKKKLWRR